MQAFVCQGSAVTINMRTSEAFEKLGSSEFERIQIHYQSFNSLTTKKQTTKFLSANFPKMFSPSYIILRSQRLKGKQCRSR